MEVSVAAVLILGGLVVLRWGLILLGAALIVREVKECPACFATTLALRRRVLTTLLPVTEWRWCPTCGWQGPSRKRDTRWTAKSATSRV